MAREDLADEDGTTSRTGRFMGHNSRNPALYEDDFFGGSPAGRSVAPGLFRRGGSRDIVEEIETLGRSEKRELESAYCLIGMHLLRMMHQSDRVPRSGLRTIVRERNTVETVLDASPSLKARRAELLAKAYRQARKEAAAETGLSLEIFPRQPPFSVDQVEDDHFIPLAVGDAGRPIEDTGAADIER